MTDKEAMKLALAALEQMKAKANFECWNLDICDEAIAAIKERLAQDKALQALHNENERLGLYKDAYAQQEPVAWAMPQGWWIVESTPDNLKMWPTNEGELFVAGVTQPPQRTEQNFCSRCGKRTNDIHTCTPPPRRTHES
jgi:hypothetical protein